MQDEISTNRPLPIWLAWVALALNGFAFVVVNVAIYWVRVIWINNHPGGRPPTISRAIADPDVGPIFALWVSIAAAGLVIGVGILVWHYFQLGRRIPNKGMFLSIAVYVFVPLCGILQVISSWGIHWLSIYRMPFATQMHMTGSYMFFSAQAICVLLFAFYSIAILRRPEALAVMENAGLISVKWVKRRMWLAFLSVGLVFVYLALFILKGIYKWDTYPTLYRAYVSVEPAVITGFLLVVMLCHVDLFRNRRG